MGIPFPFFEITEWEHNKQELFKWKENYFLEVSTISVGGTRLYGGCSLVGPSGVRKPKTKFLVLYPGLGPSIVVEYKNRKRKKKSIFQIEHGTKSLN